MNVLSALFTREIRCSFEVVQGINVNVQVKFPGFEGSFHANETDYVIPRADHPCATPSPSNNIENKFQVGSRFAQGSIKDN